MSAPGQTRRFRDVRGMAGLPQAADISGPGRHFAFVPEAEVVRRAIGLQHDASPFLYIRSIFRREWFTFQTGGRSM
jgi:hypothetical protein